MTRDSADTPPQGVDSAGQDHAPIAAVDAGALRFVRGWHQFPGLREHLCFHGINVGEMMEYDLAQAAFTILAEAQQDSTR